MTGTMEMKVQDFDGKLYYFVMNLFNVDVEAGVRSGQATKLTGDDGLGPDMFFSMTPQGEIPTIWYQAGDSAFFINVKASAISALQTRLVAPNEQKVFRENDLIGIHTSVFNAKAAPSGLNITKTYTQTDFITFADKSVSKATFSLSGVSTVSVHPSGYITGSSSQQQVVFVSAASGFAKKNKAASLGFESNLMSFGDLDLTLSGTRATRLQASHDNVNKKATTLLEIGSSASLSPSTNLPKIKTGQELRDLLSKGSKTNYEQLRSIVRLFKANPDLVTVFSVDIHENLDNQVVLNRWLYILNSLDTTQSNTLLRQLLQNKQTRKAVLNALPGSLVSDCSLISVVSSFVFGPEKEAALIALGSLARRCPSTQHQQKAKDILVESAQNAKRVKDESVFYAASAGLENAGVPTGSVGIAVPETGLYPFNRSFDKSISVGGSQLGADFDLDLFVGTNFNCNHPQFNYQGSAVASATAKFLGDSKSAFLGKAIYGTANGQRLENILYLRVWDDVIYNTPIPTLDCSAHRYPIASYSGPGLDVTYTIWVSIIPVTFTAGLNVEMNLDWGWQICDTDLSATVELIPDAKLVASASASSDLIVIEGGISISANFEVIPEPKAFIHGSECEVGVNVEVSYDPMEASIDVWWRRNVCEFWIYDCH